MAVKRENIRIHITMPRNLYEKIANEADYEERSISRQITRIVKEHYKEDLDEDE